MISDVKEPHRRLRQRKQSAFRDRRAGRSVGMRHAVDVAPGHVDGAMNHEAGCVDAIVRGVEEDVAVEIDLDQTG